MTPNSTDGPFPPDLCGGGPDTHNINKDECCCVSNDLLFYLRPDRSLYILQWLPVTGVPVLARSELMPTPARSELMPAPARREGR